MEALENMAVAVRHLPVHDFFHNLFATDSVRGTFQVTEIHLAAAMDHGLPASVTSAAQGVIDEVGLNMEKDFFDILKSANTEELINKLVVFLTNLNADIDAMIGRIDTLLLELKTLPNQSLEISQKIAKLEIIREKLVEERSVIVDEIKSLVEKGSMIDNNRRPGKDAPMSKIIKYWSKAGTLEQSAGSVARSLVR